MMITTPGLIVAFEGARVLLHCRETGLSGWAVKPEDERGRGTGNATRSAAEFTIRALEAGERVLQP
jgi:hypothetical protein